MRVFVSHISEEAAVAAILKDWIESTFLGHVSVFVSSDPADIPAGSKWLEEIDSALQSTALLITLFSKASLNRPWISFEAGCAWIRSVPIIPICHAGLSVRDLRQPLAGFQGLDIGDSKFGEKLFSAIAKRLNVAKLPKISFPEFEAEIRKASAATQSSSEVGDDASQIAPTDDASLAEAHYKILKTLAAHKDAGHGAMDEPQLAAALGTKRTLLSLKIKPLVSARLVHDHLRMGGPIGYSITERGIALLVRKGLLK